MTFKLFNTDLVKSNLAISSLMITGYEVLQSTVINKIKSFMCMESEIVDGELVLIESTDYLSIKNEKHPELGGRKNIYVASCKWLLEQECISPMDYEMLQEVRKYRNELAHKLPNFIIDDSFVIDIKNFDKIQYLIGHIEKWWILTFEVPVNPDYDNIEVTKEDVTSGIIILMQHLESMMEVEITKLRELKI